MAKDTLILGIETSCDDTSIAVVKNGRELLSNVVSSQLVHKEFGGVIPEVAARHHDKRIIFILEKALKEAAVALKDIDAIAVTKGPGLVGSLLIGISLAKAISFSLDLPLIAVNHLAGHIYASNFVSNLEFPLISLIVSGGHTLLVYMAKHLSFEVLGKTLDDACGEVFDKVARLLDLPYPGGPYIDKLSKNGKLKYFLPKALLKTKNYNFSFSGLKTAVRKLVEELKETKEFEENIENIAYSFQAAVVDVLVTKTMEAVYAMDVKNLVLGGGVAANSFLREKLIERSKKLGLKVFIPPLNLCTDNAAMIASVGTYQYLEKDFSDLALNPDPNFPL